MKVLDTRAEDNSPQQGYPGLPHLSSLCGPVSKLFVHTSRSPAVPAHTILACLTNTRTVFPALLAAHTGSSLSEVLTQTHVFPLTSNGIPNLAHIPPTHLRKHCLTSKRHNRS